jgi:hypothetical protein
MKSVPARFFGTPDFNSVKIGMTDMRHGWIYFFNSYGCFLGLFVNLLNYDISYVSVQFLLLQFPNSGYAHGYTSGILLSNQFMKFSGVCLEAL